MSEDTTGDTTWTQDLTASTLCDQEPGDVETMPTPRGHESKAREIVDNSELNPETRMKKGNT